MSLDILNYSICKFKKTIFFKIHSGQEIAEGNFWKYYPVIAKISFLPFQTPQLWSVKKLTGNIFWKISLFIRKINNSWLTPRVSSRFLQEVFEKEQSICAAEEQPAEDAVSTRVFSCLSRQRKCSVQFSDFCCCGGVIQFRETFR